VRRAPPPVRRCASGAKQFAGRLSQRPEIEINKMPHPKRPGPAGARADRQGPNFLSRFPDADSALSRKLAHVQSAPTLALPMFQVFTRAKGKHQALGMVLAKDDAPA
jgi:hypothetical protein